MKRAAAFLVVGTVLVVGCGARSVLDDVGPYGVLVDAGFPSDGSMAGDGAPADAAPIVDAGRDVTPVPIGSLVPCGTENCFPQTEECCVSLTGGQPACALKGKCANGIGLSCTSSMQCAKGDVCCVSFGGGGGGGGGGIGATCQTTCGGPGAIQLCTTNQECPSGEQCTPTLLGVGYCAAPAGGRDAGGGGRMDAGGGVVDAGGGMLDSGGGVVDAGGGMLDSGGGAVDAGGGMLDSGGGAVDAGGGMLDSGGGIVDGGGD